MNLYTARQKAELEYKAALAEYRKQPTRRNEDRLNIKRALLEGLQRWIAEKNYGGAR